MGCLLTLTDNKPDSASPGVLPLFANRFFLNPKHHRGELALLCSPSCPLLRLLPEWGVVSPARLRSGRLRLRAMVVVARHRGGRAAFLGLPRLLLLLVAALLAAVLGSRSATAGRTSSVRGGQSISLSDVTVLLPHAIPGSKYGVVSYDLRVRSNLPARMCVLWFAACSVFACVSAAANRTSLIPMHHQLTNTPPPPESKHSHAQTQADGGCFQWRLDLQSVISLTPLQHSRCTSSSGAVGYTAVRLAPVPYQPPMVGGAGHQCDPNRPETCDAAATQAAAVAAGVASSAEDAAPGRQSVWVMAAELDTDERVEWLVSTACFEASCHTRTTRFEADSVVCLAVALAMP